MKEEYLLEQKFGKPRPFNVPDGYFEQFEAEIINKFSAEKFAEDRPIRRWLRPVTWAACAAIAVVSAFVYFRNANVGTDVVASVHADELSPAYNDNIVDELSDFAMLDNDDLYSLMADE